MSYPQASLDTLLPKPANELWVSPSQFELVDECNRKWWFKYGPLRLREPEKGFQVLGTALHAVAERFLKADELGRDRATQQPVDLYPEGWDQTISPTESALVKKLIKTAIDDGILIRSPGIKVEHEIKRQIAERDGIKIILNAYIDVMTDEGVDDHKTTSNFKYAKSPKELTRNIQMLTYAMEYLEQKHLKGQPFPEKIRLRHIVYSKDPSNQKIKVTPAYVTPEEVFAFWGAILDQMIPNMLSVRQLTQWDQVPGPENTYVTCNKYGGCPFRTICARQETTQQYQVRIPSKPRTSKDFTTKEPTMGLMDKIRAAPPVTTAPPQGLNPTPPPSMPTGNNGPFAPAQQFTPLPQQPQHLVQDDQEPEPPMMQDPDGDTPDFEMEVVPTAQTQLKGLGSAPSIPQQEKKPVKLMAMPPWAVQGCTACGTSQTPGFSSAGSPCRICDQVRHKAGGTTSSYFDLATTHDGFVIWTPKPELAQALINMGYRPSDQEKQAVQVLAKTSVTVAEAQDAADDSETESNGFQQPPDPTGQRRRPGRPRKDAAVPGLPAVTEKRGFVMMLGCRNRKSPGTRVIFMEEVVSSIGAQIALNDQKGSYYQGDVWKRRDALASLAPEIAKTMGTSILMVSRVTTDTEPLIDALMALAYEVIEADGFFLKRP